MVENWMGTNRRSPLDLSMSASNSNDLSRGMRQLLASVQELTRTFEAMTARGEISNARIKRLCDSLPPPANAGASNPGDATISPDIQKFIESQARQKEAGKELVIAASAFAQALIQWAEKMKKRQKELARKAAANQPASGDDGSPVNAAARAEEAKKFARLTEVYFAKAKDENELAGPTALIFDGVGQPDDQDRHKLAAKEAADIAEEMQRRAYILANGTEDNYRQLVIDKYEINNPDLDKIMAYYARNFNDQDTPNWLKLQHPAVLPSLDQTGNDVGMMALFPQFDKMGEAAGELPLTEKPQKRAFLKRPQI
jgi:hypothetical protein